MRILLARIAALNGRNGGMEHVEARMANAMIKRGHEVGVLSYDTHDGSPYYSIDSSVRMLNLNNFVESTKHSLALKCIREVVRPFSRRKFLYWKNRWRYSYFSGAIRTVLDKFRPDVIVSFDAESSAVFFGTCPELKIPLITMFHFSVDEAVNWADAQEIEALKKSDCVQVLLKDDLVKLKKRLPQVQVVCIPNVVPEYSVMADLGKKKTTYTIIDVARLTKNQKRPYLLIEAFSRLAEKYPEWCVQFWGSEPDGNTVYTRELQKLIESKNLGDKVTLCGNTNDVLSKYINADIIVLPSAYEGFPLALSEGMSAGLPGVGFRKCMGVNEIIEDGRTGYLVGDGAEELGEGLKKLMENQRLRVKMGKAAHQAMKRYEPERIWLAWETLLNDMVKGKQWRE